MVSITSLPKIGPKTLERLNRLNIFSATDLLYHFPSRYLDFSNITPISQIKENTMVTITGQVLTFKSIYTRSGKSLQKAVVSDKTGSVELTWFNQPYLTQSIKPDMICSFAGTVSLFQKRLTLIAPIHGANQTGKILPIYPETSGLTSGWFRSFFAVNLPILLSDITDPLPLAIIKKYNLPALSLALKEIHSPSSQKMLELARYRLSIDEILTLQVSSYLRKADWSKKSPHKILKCTKASETKINKFIKSLPFKLTPSQTKTWAEIKSDLLSTVPTNRLLQGDVGSGKTIIAILACYLTSLNKANSLVLAPTEILARQHLATFKKYLPVPIYLLTANSKIDFTKLETGSVIISTHAAVYHKKHFEDKLGLLIVDEQHKFGVEQRTFLTNTLAPPHCITMTATPIPRTISLTILGNLDLSLIESPPINRKKIQTFLVPPQKYSHCYQWLDDHITKNHHQAFIVCPFIEASETLTSVKSAKVMFEELKVVFPHQSLGLIHGTLKEVERTAILDKFAKNIIQILVTTPIIEVGIDFPNATTIVIQSADRFGLAQLHQLRGRVGRGEAQSFCYLFTKSSSDKALNRLKMLETTSDGQKIAEYDLKTRGPGEAFSYIQHGFPSLKIANLSDYKLIATGQEIITTIIQNYPTFNLKTLTHLSDKGLVSTN